MLEANLLWDFDLKRGREWLRKKNLHTNFEIDKLHSLPYQLPNQLLF